MTYGVQAHYNVYIMSCDGFCRVANPYKALQKVHLFHIRLLDNEPQICMRAFKLDKKACSGPRLRLKARVEASVYRVHPAESLALKDLTSQSQRPTSLV